VVDELRSYPVTKCEILAKGKRATRFDAGVDKRHLFMAYEVLTEEHPRIGIQ
jgi:hypothetical protein